jgi:hypothetical protein
MGFFKKLLSIRSGGTKEPRVVFFECQWFDPINDTRVDAFGMVVVKHKLRYSGKNILLAYQAQ